MKTELICITDRSGSMATIRVEAEGAFNKFMADQKATPGECRVTSVTFDNQYELQYQARPVSEVPPMRIEPRGMTALYDAIGKTLNDQGHRIALDKWAELVIVVITTDGAENASREFTAAAVKTMIQHAELNGWKIMYLGANQDAFKVSAGLGVGTYSGVKGQSFLADAQGTQHAFEYASANTVQLRSGMPMDLSAVADPRAQKVPEPGKPEDKLKEV